MSKKSKINKINLDNLYFKLYEFLHSNPEAIAFCNNSVWLNQLANHLSSTYKDNCDLTLSFFFESQLLFVVYSSVAGVLDYHVDVSSMNLDTFAKLMFGQQKCSDFLAASFSNSDLANSDLYRDYSIQDAFANMRSSWTNYKTRLGYNEDSFFEVDEIHTARSKISKEHILWCHNKSCTGKSYLGINTLNYLGKPCIVFNRAVDRIGDTRFLRLVLEHATNCSVLIDDLQCDIDFARFLLPFLAKNAEDIKRRNIYIFLVSWTSLAESSEFREYTQIIPIIRTKPQKYITLMQKKLANTALRSICGDNLSLINTAIEIQKHTPKNIATDYEKKLFQNYVQTEDLSQIKLIYILAVLGAYEFETPIRFLDQYGSLDYDSVKTVKIQENQIFLAHRTVSNFIAYYIEKHYELPITRKSIIKKYIKYIDSRKKWSALVHLIGEENQTELLSVSPLWALMYYFQSNLRQQTLKDPSWNNTPSSMYFVLSTAEILGVVDEYEDVIEALCHYFSVADGRVNVKYDELKTTDDFVFIREKMEQEDLSNPPTEYEEAQTLNLELIHKNWLFGLLIGLKNVLIDYGHKELVDAVEKELLYAQDPEGFWYPKRVPWVSARIMIGLATAGFSKSDECIQKGIEYLYNSSTAYHWLAHTGGWNNEYETTSLCLEALIKSGEDCECEFLQKAANLLLSKSQVWMKPEYDIDGTTSACALLKILGVKQEMLSYIESLAVRNIHEIVDSFDQLDYSQSQSCEITQIAYYCIELCWYLLEKDIPSLLDKFIERSEYGGDVMQSRKIFISYIEENRTIERIRKIAHHLSAQGFTVFFYDDLPVGTNLPEFMNKITESDAILVIGTKKYKEKAEAIRRGGVWYEFCVLSHEFMSQNYLKIIPMAIDQFDEAFPAVFTANKGIDAKRIDARFLERLTNYLNAKFEEAK